MYDFYGNPPKTKEQIREYITTWLAPTNDPRVHLINGKSYINELGFKRAFYVHSVFKTVDTNEYCWYVYPCEQETFEDFPVKKFPNFESLIDNVVDSYYIEWGLNKDK